MSFLIQEIAIGSYSVCKKCVNKSTGKEYAVKVGLSFSYKDTGWTRRLESMLRGRWGYYARRVLVPLFHVTVLHTILGFHVTS